MQKYFSLSDFHAYKLSFHLSQDVWKIVSEWDSFSKNTIGRQFVNAIDSISANIAEGFGRHTKKERINFYRYARGSTWEALDWLEKAKRRNLIDETSYKNIFMRLRKLPAEINFLIKHTNEKLTI